MKKKELYVLSLGHLCSDINQSIISSILPFLIAANHYDYTTASLLVTVSNLFGSIAQPIFGAYADKKSNPFVMVVGVFLACLGMALTGLTSNYFLLCIFVIISGIGIALFHPQAAKLVNQTSASKKKGKGISVFAFGGKIGFTLGPIFTAFLISKFGIQGTIFFLIPSIVFSIFALKTYKVKTIEIENKEKEETVLSNQKDDWKAFIFLIIIIFGRSIISNGTSTFLSLYFIQKYSMSAENSSLILSFYYAFGSIATLLAGMIADKVGCKKIIKLSFLIMWPSIILLIFSKNVILSLLFLIPLAASESLSYSPLVVSSQSYLPNHTGFASGISLGLSVSIGALVCPLLGVVSDTYGLNYAFYILCGTAVVLSIMSVFIKEVKE